MHTRMKNSGFAGTARLYAFVDTAFLHGRDPTVLTRMLCDGGADIIQLRAKNETPDQVLQLAEKILPVSRAAGIPLVINDHLEIARRVGAEACHLGQEDFFATGHTHVNELRTAHESLGIGLSTHSPEQAMRAIAAGADYLGVGPVWPTGTKPNAAPVTLEYVKWAAHNLRIPWFAIGGVNLETLDAALEAGARRVCVVSGILNAPDVAAQCRRFKVRLAQHPL